MFASGNLPKTKTRNEWSWFYLPLFTPTGLAVGRLTVTETTGKRVQRMVTDVYDLDVTPMPAGCRGQAFLLCKTHHDGDTDTVKGKKSAGRIGQVYECRLHTSGTHECTCDGGVTEKGRPDGSACLHVLACREMVNGGVFDDLEPVTHMLDRAGTVGEDDGDYRESADGNDPQAWWAEAAGGKLVCEVGGC